MLDRILGYTKVNKVHRERTQYYYAHASSDVLLRMCIVGQLVIKVQQGKIKFSRFP